MKEGGRRKRRKEEGGRRKEEGGRRKEEGGRRKEEGGRRALIVTTSIYGAVAKRSTTNASVPSACTVRDKRNPILSTVCQAGASLVQCGKL
jgi:hypothetical protein